MRIVSIDLAARSQNPSGVAVLEDGQIVCSTLHGDEDLIGLAARGGACMVGIDAPLSIPYGRADIDDRSGPHLRACDNALRERGIRFFPVTLGFMRTLAKRGMMLKGRLERIGIPVHEIFPGASFDILGLPRKDIGAANRFLSSYGCDARSVHESDAAIGAYTLLMHFQGGSDAVGGPDGRIILPARS